MIATSDVVSVHTPLNAETRGFISAEAFAAAKSGLVLINTARGPIIDLDALAEAMRGCRLADAGLDLLPTKEPADPRHPLIAAWTAREDWLRGRLLLTPHAAFYSAAAIQDRQRKAGSPIAEPRVPAADRGLSRIILQAGPTNRTDSPA